VGTVLEAGKYSVSGELKKGSVVYSRIFLEYSSSTAWLASRPGFKGMVALGWANKGAARHTTRKHRRLIISRNIPQKPGGKEAKRRRSEEGTKNGQAQPRRVRVANRRISLAVFGRIVAVKCKLNGLPVEFTCWLSYHRFQSGLVTRVQVVYPENAEGILVNYK
jgi:hypothetical protein